MYSCILNTKLLSVKGLRHFNQVSVVHFQWEGINTKQKRPVASPYKQSRC